MAQNTTLSVPAGTWTQITDADVTNVTFQNIGGVAMFVAGTAGAVVPTSTIGSLQYGPRQGEANVDLADLFPGVAATRIYVFATSNIEVFVSHA